MKHILALGLVLSGMGSIAQAITVKENEIVGKTRLVAITEVTLRGKALSILADSKGLSLYTFALDSAGTSKCTGPCLSVWPPQHVPAGEKVLAPFNKIKGNDGQLQLTLEGLPLYHFGDDKRPGDVFGQYPKWDVVAVEK
jgi:predicted lipoprotein with Yx(FWY)xxD motif